MYDERVFRGHYAGYYWKGTGRLGLFEIVSVDVVWIAVTVSCVDGCLSDRRVKEWYPVDIALLVWCSIRRVRLLFESEVAGGVGFQMR